MLYLIPGGDNMETDVLVICDRFISIDTRSYNHLDEFDRIINKYTSDVFYDEDHKHIEANFEDNEKAFRCLVDLSNFTVFKLV